MVVDGAHAHGAFFGKLVSCALMLKAERIEHDARLRQVAVNVERSEIDDALAGAIRHCGAADVLGVHPGSRAIDQLDDSLCNVDDLGVVFDVRGR